MANDDDNEDDESGDLTNKDLNKMKQLSDKEGESNELHKMEAARKEFEPKNAPSSPAVFQSSCHDMSNLVNKSLSSQEQEEAEFSGSECLFNQDFNVQ